MNKYGDVSLIPERLLSVTDLLQKGRLMSWLISESGMGEVQSWIQLGKWAGVRCLTGKGLWAPQLPAWLLHTPSAHPWKVPYIGKIAHRLDIGVSQAWMCSWVTGLRLSEPDDGGGWSGLNVTSMTGSVVAIRWLCFMSQVQTVIYTLMLLLVLSNQKEKKKRTMS